MSEFSSACAVHGINRPPKESIRWTRLTASKLIKRGAQPNTDGKSWLLEESSLERLFVQRVWIFEDEVVFKGSLEEPRVVVRGSKGHLTGHVHTALHPPASDPSPFAIGISTLNRGRQIQSFSPISLNTVVTTPCRSMCSRCSAPLEARMWVLGLWSRSPIVTVVFRALRKA